MRLYYHPVSTNARRVLMTAAHLNAPLELVLVDLKSQDERILLREINPNEKVPVLDDGDFRLWESCAIMQYLADSTPGQTIYPTQLQARVDINRWMFWATQHFAPAIAIFGWENYIKPMIGAGQPNPVELARAEPLFAQFAGVLDAHLDGREWISGDSLTLADFAVAAPLAYAEQAKLPLARHAHIVAWLARVAALAAWRQANG